MKSLEGEGRARTTAIWDRLPGKVRLKAARWAAWGGALEVTPEEEHRHGALSFCTEASFCQSFPSGNTKA